MTAARQRSSSARSDNLDVDRGAQPATQLTAATSVPGDLVLNDVPAYNVNSSSSSFLLPSYGSGSPYPTITPSSSQYTLTQRPRAATIEPSSPSVANNTYRGLSRPVPGLAMYQPGQRHASGSMASGQYVPPPPPMSPPVQQAHMMSLPPPPPRLIPGQQQQHPAEGSGRVALYC